MKNTSRFYRLLAVLIFFIAFLLFLPRTVFAAISPAEIGKKNSGLSPLRNLVRVAIIDTGVDIHHEKLKNSIWINLGEKGYDKNGRNKSNNGIDDDQNGFIDDVNGWNFVDGNNDVTDLHGHGTHIAGIIQKHNRLEILVIKALDQDQFGQKAIEATVAAIDYAIKMHADIINYSGGGNSAVPEEMQALNRAKEKGILVVAAAGNAHHNSDSIGFYPANYGLENIISVAAVDDAGVLLPTSNFGLRSVTLAATGKEIRSTLPSNSYGKMSGTSQATAIVTNRLIGLIGSVNPLQDLLQIGQRKNLLFGKLKNPIVISEIKE